MSMPMPMPMQPSRERERGSALIVALILVVVLTVIGFGVITRSLLVTRIAGSERWSTKTFYAADAGMEVAKARLRIRRTAGFDFQLQDLRGPTGAEDFGDILVRVGLEDIDGDGVLDDVGLAQVGPPRPALGTQVGGGQGGSEPLYMFAYKGTSEAEVDLTRTLRRVTGTMSVGPMPLSIPQ